METIRMVREKACLLLVSLRVQVGKKEYPIQSLEKVCRGAFNNCTGRI